MAEESTPAPGIAASGIAASGIAASGIATPGIVPDELNEPQARAVAHVDGPLLIFAGAGSGKTRVIVYRIANLVAVHRVPPYRILAVTFTNKAAGEMKERLGHLLGEEIAKDLWVGTFHSVCVRLLRRYHEAAGLGPSFLIYDDGDQRTLMNRIAREIQFSGVKLDEKRFPPKQILARIHAAKQEGKGPEDVAAEPVWGPIVKACFEAYEARLRAADAIDFDDIMLRILVLVEDAESAVGKEIAGRFRHVLVDEFQDSNQIQYRLVRALSSSTRNLCVVGDDDQCHPPGVMVSMDRDEAVPIEALRASSSVMSWNRNAQKMVCGRNVRIGERPYDGSIVTICVAGDRYVPMTPNHRLICRWIEPKNIGTCVVYLMWREGFGFRVGWCQLFNVEGVLHVVQRARIEKADRVWILSTFDSRTDASVYESVVAAKYGLPTVTFEPVAGAKHLTEQSIGRIFALLADDNERRGREALDAFGRSFELPFYPWPNSDPSDPKRQRGTYFEVFASNVLANFMAVPLPDGQNTWGTVDRVERSCYTGSVYSLDVEKDHSYAVNGVVVLNSIYAWRGADVRIVRGFRDDFPEAVVVKLEQNYRSHGHIVKGALGVIKPAKEREPKELWTSNVDGEPVRIVTCEDEHDEAAFVAARIRAIREKEAATGRAPLSIAIFYRIHAQSRVLEEVLLKERIPYQIVGGVRFFERAEIKDVLSYMRVVNNPKSDVDLVRVINKPSRKIGDSTVEKLMDDARAQNSSLFDALASAETEASTLGVHARGAVLHFRELLDGLVVKAKKMSPSDLARCVLDESGYEAMLRAEESVEAEARLGNLRELVGSILAYENEATAAGEKVTLHGYLERVTLQSDVDTLSTSGERVVMMTVHAAKGLEFDTVFLTGMEEELFPYKSQDASRADDLEEERRLAYVAVTRARKRLCATYTLRRSIFGRMRQAVSSRFLGDLPEVSVRRLITPALANRGHSVPAHVPPRPVVPRSPELGPALDVATIAPGVEVAHDTFGVGVVLAVNATEDPILTVKFPGYPPKMIKARFFRSIVG